MKNETESEKLKKRHQAVAATCRRWLEELGFEVFNSVQHAEGEHLSLVEFWRNGGRVVIMHERIPLDGCSHPRPLCDLYRTIDESNQMDKTREALWEYAGQPK